jgi:hypothetical protein
MNYAMNITGNSFPLPPQPYDHLTVGQLLQMSDGLDIDEECT